MSDARALLVDIGAPSGSVPFLAGAATALVSVWLTFYLRKQRDLFTSVRALETELDLNVQLLEELATLLAHDLRRQHVDLPIEVPPGSSIEIRYVISFPSSLSTTAFDQLKRSGMFLELPPDLRRRLFDLYDTIDRINRLRRHRETLHFNNVDNVHIVIDPSELDVEPDETVYEDDLPPETRRQLDALRRMRRGMEGVNTSILRLIASVSSPSMVDELELDSYVDRDRRSPPGAAIPAFDGREDIEAVLDELGAFRRRSVWSRFV